MKKILSVLLCVALLASFGLTMSGCQSDSPKNFKVGFIYVGPVGDEGFTYMHDLARQAVEKELGITTYYVESVPEGAECATQIENLVKKGCKLIFTTSYGFMDYTVEMAEKYPDVNFMHFSGYKTAANLGTYMGRMYQARYLAGIAAGKATKTNKIGYTAAMPIPETVRGIDAFTLGVRSVNPEATVNVVWTNTWVDAAIEKQGTESLLAAGCDVVAQHQDSAAGVIAAEAAGAYSTGYHSSMIAKAPKGYLTSPIWNFTDYYRTVIKDAMEGKFSNERVWYGLDNGLVLLDQFGPSVTDETKTLISEKEALIKSGDWDVFTGPIKDQDGNVKIAEGQKMTDDEMENMMWFVEGVVGSVEAK
ncbi:MAG: BMP family ABC transporter substrate-binding protein [Eubacteriales bacterium]|nr:BMP family ABC transporter substrate-binding protein [Eubacteriales bacterium]